MSTIVMTIVDEHETVKEYVGLILGEGVGVKVRARKRGGTEIRG